MAQLDDRIWNSSLCLSNTGNFRQNPRRSSPLCGAAPLPFAWILPRLYAVSWVRIQALARQIHSLPLVLPMLLPGLRRRGVGVRCCGYGRN
jgi:hypothetical protein